MQPSRFWQRLMDIALGILLTTLAVLITQNIALRRLLRTQTEGGARPDVAEEPAARPVAPSPLPQAAPSPRPIESLPQQPPQTTRSEPTIRPILEQVPARAANGPGQGRRVLMSAGIVILLATLAVSTLYSARIFSAVFAQTNNTPAQAARPQPIRPAFQRGVIYPRWYQDAYGLNDTAWQQGVETMKKQTGGQWLEIPVLFSQAANNSTSVTTSSSAPSVQSFVEGIQRAHALSYKVFFVPLMQVRQPGGWSGSITFTTEQQEQAWFASYWAAIQPYVQAAASQRVEQMAIGTELQALQQIVPDALWNQLIAQFRATFSGTLTYDMNWSSLSQPHSSWLRSPALAYIGVSTYIPLLDKAGRVNPADIPALWRAKILPRLDALAQQLGKSILLTEIGYRNSTDALYHSWEAQTTAQPDPQEQAGAFEAALSNAFTDNHIAGTFFWGWDDVGRFAFKDQPASQVLFKWYTR